MIWCLSWYPGDPTGSHSCKVVPARPCVSSFSSLALALSSNKTSMRWRILYLNALAPVRDLGHAVVRLGLRVLSDRRESERGQTQKAHFQGPKRFGLFQQIPTHLSTSVLERHLRRWVGLPKMHQPTKIHRARTNVTHFSGHHSINLASFNWVGVIKMGYWGWCAGLVGYNPGRCGELAVSIKKNSNCGKESQLWLLVLITRR